METNSVIELARRILDCVESDELVSLIEQYAKAFDEWYSSTCEGTDMATIKSKVGTDKLAELLNLHAEVMKRTGELKEDVSGDIRKLKKKGKGILAYTDTLPKRISVTRKRKG
jgi:hypothetical protein